MSVAARVAEAPYWGRRDHDLLSRALEQPKDQEREIKIAAVRSWSPSSTRPARAWRRDAIVKKRLPPIKSTPASGTDLADDEPGWARVVAKVARDAELRSGRPGPWPFEQQPGAARRHPGALLGRLDGSAHVNLNRQDLAAGFGDDSSE